MNQNIKEWIDMADTDYGVAEHLFKTYYPKPYEIICYLIIASKLLKR